MSMHKNVTKQIKKDGLASLKRKWAFPIFMMLVFAAVYLVASYIVGLFTTLFDSMKILNYTLIIFDAKYDLNTVILQILSYVLNFGLLLFFLPLGVGMTKWYVNNIKDTNPQNNDFYYYFSKKNFGKAFGMRFLISLKMYLWGILFSIPSSIIFSIAFMMEGESFNQFQTGDFSLFSLQIPFLIFGAIVAIISTIGLLFISYRYIFSDYILIEYPNLPISKINSSSIYYAKNNYINIFKFQLSFLPWLLCCVFVIPILFIYPYYKSSISIYMEYIIYSKNAEYKKQLQAQQLNEQNLNINDINNINL